MTYHDIISALTHDITQHFQKSITWTFCDHRLFLLAKCFVRTTTIIWPTYKPKKSPKRLKLIKKSNNFKPNSVRWSFSKGASPIPVFLYFKSKPRYYPFITSNTSGTKIVHHRLFFHKGSLVKAQQKERKWTKDKEWVKKRAKNKC